MIVCISTRYTAFRHCTVAPGKAACSPPADGSICVYIALRRGGARPRLSAADHGLMFHRHLLSFFDKRSSDLTQLKFESMKFN